MFNYYRRQWPGSRRPEGRGYPRRWSPGRQAQRCSSGTVLRHRAKTSTLTSPPRVHSRSVHCTYYYCTYNLDELRAVELSSYLVYPAFRVIVKLYISVYRMSRGKRKHILLFSINRTNSVQICMVKISFYPLSHWKYCLVE